MTQISNLAAAVAQYLTHATGREIDHQLFRSVLDVASGDMPLPIPCYSPLESRVSSPPLFAPKDAVERALAPQHARTRASAFSLYLGITYLPGERQSVELTEAAGAILVCGPTGVGKTVFARYLLQQFFARGWGSLIVPVDLGESEWDGFGTIVGLDPKQTTENHSKAIVNWRGITENAIAKIYRALNAHSSKPGRRLVVVVDFPGRLSDHEVAHLLESVSAHGGMLILLQQHGLLPLTQLDLPRAPDAEQPPQISRVINLLPPYNDDTNLPPRANGSRQLRAWSWRWSDKGWYRNLIEVKPLPANIDSAKDAGKAVRRMLAMTGVDVSLSQAYNVVALARGCSSWPELSARWSA